MHSSTTTPPPTTKLITAGLLMQKLKIWIEEEYSYMFIDDIGI